MNATTSQIHVSITGTTAAEVLAHARALGGTTAISTVGNDELLAELRDRFAKLVPPMVVRVEPFASETSSGAATSNDNASATKPLTAAEKKAAAKAATEAALKEAAEKAAAGKEPPKETVSGAQEAGGDDWGSEEGETSEAVTLTMDDVKAALNDCSAKNGQAATREIMKTKGGSMRLLDIAADKYPALVEALKAA